MQCLKSSIRLPAQGRRAVLARVAEAEAPAVKPPAVKPSAATPETPVAEANAEVQPVKPVAEVNPKAPVAAPAAAAIQPAAAPAAAAAPKAPEPVPMSQAPLSPPEWAEPLQPALDFFNAQDVTLDSVVAPITSSDLYQKYLKDYVESDVAKESFGWKPLPESINGRAAMLGFLAAAGAEVFGQGSVLSQLASAGLPVFLTIALVTVGSVVPVYLGSKGEYLESLRDVYSIPQGWFTEANERVHGRLAMLGLGSLIALELILGHALL